VEDFDREVYAEPQRHTQGQMEVTSATREMNGNEPVVTKRLLAMSIIPLTRESPWTSS